MLQKNTFDKDSACIRYINDLRVHVCQHLFYRFADNLNLKLKRKYKRDI